MTARADPSDFITDDPPLITTEVQGNKCWPNGEESTPQRETCCELEVDSWPWSIENKNWIQERASEPFKAVHNRTEKLVHSLETIWEKERQRKAKIDSQTSNAPQSSAPSMRVAPTQTDVEREVLDAIESINGRFYSQREKLRMNPQSICSIPTAYQSITALFPSFIDEVSSSPDNDLVNFDTSISLSGHDILKLLESDGSHPFQTQRSEVDFDSAEILQWMADEGDDSMGGNEIHDSSSLFGDELEEDENFQIPQFDGAGETPPNMKKTSLTAAWSTISGDSRSMNTSPPPFKFSPPCAVTPSDYVFERRPESVTELSSKMSLDLNRHMNANPQQSLVPPSVGEIEKCFLKDRINLKEYRDPYYSNQADFPQKPKFFGGRTYNLPSVKDTNSLPFFQSFVGELQSFKNDDQTFSQKAFRYLTTSELPPSVHELQIQEKIDDMKDTSKRAKVIARKNSQVCLRSRHMIN